MREILNGWGLSFKVARHQFRHDGTLPYFFRTRREARNELKAQIAAGWRLQVVPCRIHLKMEER